MSTDVSASISSLQHYVSFQVVIIIIQVVCTFFRKDVVQRSIRAKYVVQILAKSFQAVNSSILIFIRTSSEICLATKSG